MKDCHPKFPRMPVLCPCILQVCKNTSLLSYYNRVSYFSNYALPAKRGAQHKTDFANYCNIPEGKSCCLLIKDQIASTFFYVRKSKQQGPKTKQTYQNICKYSVSKFSL